MRELHLIRSSVQITRNARGKIEFFAFFTFVWNKNRVRAKLPNCRACVCKSSIEIRIAGYLCRVPLSASTEYMTEVWTDF